MGKIKLITIILVGLYLVPLLAIAQIPPDMPMEGGAEPDFSEEKEIDPFIQLWKLDDYGAFKDSSFLDTLLDDFHLYHPVYDDAISATYLGNYGTPYLNNNFFNRDHSNDFFFLQTREAYLLDPSKIEYYNTRTPYTVLDFSQSEHRTRKNETRFNVLHTQNINPYLNVTFRYDQARSAGQYKSQDAKNNFVTLYSNYNKDNWSFHGGFITNSIQNAENGGLDADSLIFSDDDTDLLNVNLNSTRSKFGSTHLFFNGEYKIGRRVEMGEQSVMNEEGEEEFIPVREFKPVVGFIYAFNYQNHYKEFTEDEDTTDFFRNTYFDDAYVKDSIRYRAIENNFQLKQYENPDRKVSFGKRAFIGQQFVKTSSSGPIQGINNRESENYSNIYAGGGIFRQTGSFWRWDIKGKIYFLGRNAGQTEISGLITKPFPFLGDSLAGLSISGRIENRVPDVYQQEYYSNHSKWKNDLKMEQNMTARGSFVSPGRDMELRFNYSLINNYIYNDTLGVPSQDDGQLLVLSALADKGWQLGNFNLRSRLLWQMASNEDVLHLPDFSAFVSAYYKFIVSKVLYTQIGVDTRFYTRYYADAYDPSTGLFHVQNDQQVGDFPYIDAHVNVRLKRTRVFFKMMNIGSEFLNKPYFTTPHYPMNRRTWRIGVAWTFYD